jgi:hypothetical protein
MRWAGEQALLITLGANKSHVRLSTAPTDAYAGFRINPDGTMDGTAATSLNWALDDGTWLQAGVASDFEVRATLNSGDVPAGSAVGSWLSCGSQQSWSQSVLGVDIKFSDLTIEVRNAATLIVQDSCAVYIEATVDV